MFKMPQLVNSRDGEWECDCRRWRCNVEDEGIAHMYQLWGYHVASQHSEVF